MFDEENHSFEDEDEDQIDEEQVLELGQSLEEAFQGDDRFESVEVLEPGQLEGEAFRLRLVVDDHTHFLAACLPEAGKIRIGLATDDEAVNDAIVDTAAEHGESVAEILADALEGSEESDYGVEEFDEEFHYICTEIPYEPEIAASPGALHEEIVYYLEGYVSALLEIVTKCSEA